MQRLGFVLRQLGYDMGASLLVVPALTAAVLGAGGSALAVFEASWSYSLPSIGIEPATAQVVLATLAGSMMTLISVVYSILLVALSLASVQFSTRIVAGMVRDRWSQVVLGVFVGTFIWQLVALRAIHLDPPYVPPLTTTTALGLAVASLAALVTFIDRVIHGIQANHLVDRVARETEVVLDAVYPPKGGPDPSEPPEPTADGRRLRARSSGYVQLVWRDQVRALAAEGLHVQLLRPMGTFVAEGVALWSVAPADRVDARVERALIDAVDLGPVRTMQDDVEWGFRQIVDIGLKAISPAVNDPSTGATCIDQLTRLLVRAAMRGSPVAHERVGTGSIVLPAPLLSDLVDLAFEQLRQYGRGDMAICLRLLRAIGDVLEVTDSPEARARLLVHAEEVARHARTVFSVVDLAELERRMERIAVAQRPPSVEASRPSR